MTHLRNLFLILIALFVLVACGAEAEPVIEEENAPSALEADDVPLQAVAETDQPADDTAVQADVDVNAADAGALAQPAVERAVIAQPEGYPVAAAEVYDPYPVAGAQTQGSTDAYRAPTSGNADADVVFVEAILSADNRWSFNVTVAHPDTGWDDYADGWDVVLPDGEVVKANNDPFTRLLAHPHETEQPFTRSQNGLPIPENVTFVTVRAHDIVDGWGGNEIVVDLTVDEGEGFTVRRNN